MSSALVRFLIILLFGVIQVGYLVSIAWEQQETWSLLGFVCFINIVLIFTYLKKPIHLPDFDRESKMVLFVVPMSALVVYMLNHQMGLGAVFSAGIVGVLTSFVPSIFPTIERVKKLPIAMYCGAFVGMSGLNIADGYVFIMLAGSLAGFLMYLSKNILDGVGGKLGTIAFLGVAIAYVLKNFLN